ncbi:MAG: ABC transporter permease [Anaerolineae bacterium]|nr:ABC transporter permease [Anaerolineae bacterium]
MALYIVRRLAYMVVTLVLLSITTFAIIQLPKGDYLDTVIASLALNNNQLTDAEIAGLRERYGLDQTFLEQYVKWIRNFLEGDLGMSFQWRQPVLPLILERLPATIIISLSTLLVTYTLGVLIGIYSATHQYSLGDYFASVVGFIGLATPNFLLALILLYVGFSVFNVNLLGLFSREYVDAPWSVGKLLDLIAHLPIPIIVIGSAGAAGLIRVMRAMLLDELRKQYVVTARAKGLSESRLIFKYPVRVALNPVISGLGGIFVYIVSGETITSIVLGLPTTGSLLYGALLNQDMFLAGSIVMVLSVLTVLGTLVSDLLLVIADPRIRYEVRT